METFSIGQTSARSGWSPRMLRYLEGAGLVVPGRTASGYRRYGIRELNQLSRDLQSCDACMTSKVMPVLGSGHPQADIMLVKFAPSTAEVEEGVAFYGRAGNALMKSFKRLGIDPLVIYGTVCAKCPVEDPNLADPECVARLADEFNIVQPRIVVVMGDQDIAQRPVAMLTQPGLHRGGVARIDHCGALLLRIL